LHAPIAQREPEIVLVRGDENLSFYFSSDMGGRLLAGPAPNPAPAAASHLASKEGSPQGV
jgi:hypothetical protein